MIKKRLARILSLLALLGLAACSGGGGNIQLNYCLTASGVPGDPACCQGGNGGPAIQPPPANCRPPSNIESSLEAAVEAVDIGRKALIDLENMQFNRSANKVAENVDAATAVKELGPPVSELAKDLSERPKDFSASDKNTTANGNGNSIQRTHGGNPSLRVGLTEDKSNRSRKAQAMTATNVSEITYSGGGGAKPTRKNSAFANMKNQFSNLSVTSSTNESEIAYGKQSRQPAAANGKDPEDYFSRIKIYANLFKVIENKYRQKSENWALEKARNKFIQQ